MGLVRIDGSDSFSFADGDKVVMSITETVQENCVIIGLSGELRSETVHAFQDELFALVSVGMDVVINLKETTYISSAYMKALVSAEISIEQKGKEMTIISLSDSVAEVFKKTGAMDLLSVKTEE